MYGEILQAVKALATAYAAPYDTIVLGALPEDNGLAMYLAAGSPDSEYLDRGATISCDIALNGKHSNQQTVLTALSNIHVGLSQLKEYPSAEKWKISNIRSSTAPNFIEKESSTGQWLYASVLEITFYLKGV